MNLNLFVCFTGIVRIGLLKIHVMTEFEIIDIGQSVTEWVYLMGSPARLFPISNVLLKQDFYWAKNCSECCENAFEKHLECVLKLYASLKNYSFQSE